MTASRTIVVLGSGPGIGVAVAAHFAAQGFTKVALVSRNAARLDGEDAPAVLEAAPSAEVKTYAFDLADYEGLPGLLDKIEAELGTPEAVVYNASHLTKSDLGQYTAREVEVDLRISTLSLYTTSTWALPRFEKLACSSTGINKPILLVTSGGLYQNPHHSYFSLALNKAAQHNLTQSLAQAYKAKGAHVSAIVVNGLVTPKSEIFAPKKIAEVYWREYERGVADGENSIWISAEEDKTKDWRAQAKV